MKRILYSLLILIQGWVLCSHTKAQVVLKALDKPNIPTSTPIFTPSEKCIELVKDKYYGDGVHNFIYCAVQGPDGKKWLNLNLGAEYAREGSPYFNPKAIPTGNEDWKAFGSLFQYGRDADGHELVEWRKKSDGTVWETKHVNGLTDGLLNTKVPNKYWVNWYASSNYENAFSWRRDNPSSDPCPNGYEIMKYKNIRPMLTNKIQGNFSMLGPGLVKSAISEVALMIPPNEPHLINPSANDFNPTNDSTSSLWLGGRLTSRTVADVAETYTYREYTSNTPLNQPYVFTVLDIGIYHVELQDLPDKKDWMIGTNESFYGTVEGSCENCEKGGFIGLYNAWLGSQGGWSSAVRCVSKE